jgi:FkbH-like protein
LPAFDWREATPGQVEQLLRRLDEAGSNVPAWLAKGLLVAGHRLPSGALTNCSPELNALAALNEIEKGGVPEGLSRQIVDISVFGEMESGVASAVTRRLVALGETSLACRVALSQFHASPEAMRSVQQQCAVEIKALPLLRLRLSGTSTTHDLAAALKPAFAAAGWRVEISEADFATIIPELLEPHQAADALVLLLDSSLIAGVGLRSSVSEARRLADERIEALTGAIEAFCRNASKPLLVNTIPAAFVPGAGHIDRHHATGEACLVAEVNRRLGEIAARLPSLLLVDADVALARVAPAERSDPKLWFYGRQAYNELALRALAHGFSRVWHTKARGAAKVLALDFDNTLWGGVFGDDGIERLECGDDFPGNAFKALQQECLRLKGQGMLLVGLSKNNPDAIEVFSNHPGMALKADDFVATAINWEPKPDNIRRLAAELNLGLDSFVFLDDSSQEREAMRRMCPSVSVPEMPADPARRPLWLRSLACTWPLRLTDEDARRSEMYVAERKGREFKESVRDYEQYLIGLQQKLTIEPVTSGTLVRAAQLHQRTNQFNLTNRRFSESEINAFMTEESRALGLVGQVCDRFGDLGIVLAACVSLEEATARIESFVMSCRVIGRQIEAAFLEALTAHLAGKGVKRIVGSYRPTTKNGIVRDLYPSMGFTPSGEEDGAEFWELPVDMKMSRTLSTRPVTVEWGKS